MDEDNSGSIEIIELRQAFETINNMNTSGTLREYCSNQKEPFLEWKTIPAHKIESILEKVD